MEMDPKKLVIKQEIIKEEDEVCFELIEDQSYVKEESVLKEMEQVDSCIDFIGGESCFVVDGIKEEPEIEIKHEDNIQIDNMEFKEEEINCEWSESTLNERDPLDISEMKDTSMLPYYESAQSSSSYNTSGKRTSDQGGTVVCGVCGAVRYYSFVKQAKKFGVHSCESCRKFISKMINRQGGGKLICNNFKGQCKIPPYVRNPNYSANFPYLKGTNPRCPACWLKMCLNKFSMPGNLCALLGDMLPDFMQDPAFTTSTVPDKTNLTRKKTKSDVDKFFWNCNRPRKNKDNGELEPNVRQKRKAATKCMENIARITGRVSAESVKTRLSQSVVTITKKRVTGSGTDESWSVVKNDKIKVRITKKKRVKDHVEVNTEYVDEEDKQESIGSGSPSVQAVIRKVGRPRLITLTRNIEFEGEN